MTEPVAQQASQRVFFALWPDAAARAALDDVAATSLAQCGGRRMERDSLHLTLAFIGAVSPGQLSVLHALAAKVRAEPFDLELDRLGCWPHNHILWAGCRETPSRQHRLFRALAQPLSAAGFALDARPHVPHVTLVRNARCADLPELVTPIRWRVADFTLVESFTQPAGGAYRVLARWPLRENACGLESTYAD